MEFQKVVLMQEQIFQQHFTEAHSSKASHHSREPSAKLSHKNKSVKVLWDGTYGFSALSEKTRKSNHLQMSLQRQHFLLTYLKTLNVGLARVWTRDLTTDRRSPNWANQAAVFVATQDWTRVIKSETSLFYSFCSILLQNMAHVFVVRGSLLQKTFILTEENSYAASLNHTTSSRTCSLYHYKGSTFFSVI